jgi:hypothetical protein
MQEMGQLWLKAEVNEIETKMRKVQTSRSLPPYLVLDCDAFVNHPFLIKQLVGAKKFIVIIPNTGEF